MNPLQKAAGRRKVFYFAAILGLLTVSIFYRGQEAKAASGETHVWVPFGRDDRRPENAPTAVNRAADWLARKTILSQARRAELRELEQGDPELAGNAVRLSLVGSRGAVVTSLWLAANEAQKRNDFHKMDYLVRTITRLQPHFITPWIFQSWNIAYNVSVEADKLNDMYFYIARGIQLLAEGEKRNKRSPDMRYQLGFYYQNKFGVSDKVQTLRCLFALSILPPGKRDADALLDPRTKEVDPAAFRQFCEDNPHLVRRLRDRLGCQKPADVVDFLRANKVVPTRYKTATEFKPADADDVFPAVPAAFNSGPEEVNPGTEYRPRFDDYTGFTAARAWFMYSLVLVPPNPRVPEKDATWPLPAGAPIPSPSPRPGDYDPFVYRMPRLPMLIIFRQGPPRAQTYQAEQEQKEGWFDDAGWAIDDGSDPAYEWFPGQKVVVGTGKKWSLAAWEKAAEMWKSHAEENGLSLSADALGKLRAESAGVSDAPPDISPDSGLSPKAIRQYRAQGCLYYYGTNRSVTNVPYFLASSQAEARKETVAARKLLWEADRLRKGSNTVQALAKYRDGLTLWKKVLADDAEFHRPDGRGDRTEEETFEYEIDYLRLAKDSDEKVRRKVREQGNALAAAIPYLLAAPNPGDGSVASPLWRPGMAEELAWVVAEATSPFAGTMPAGELRAGAADPRADGPWIRDDIKESVRQRQNVVRRKPGDDQPPPAPPQGMPQR